MSSDPDRPEASRPERAPSRRGKKRERNAAETKRRLLDAAETEFALKGFAGARLRDVARTVGVQQALIHHYFGDKDGLYRAVLDRALEQSTLESWSILEQPRGVEAMLEDFVSLLVRFHRAHSNLFAMMRMEANTGTTNVGINVMRERTKPIFDAVELAWIGFQKEGKVRADIKPTDALVLVLAMTIYPFQEAPLLSALWTEQEEGPEALEERKLAIVRMCKAGLLPQAK